MRPFTKLLWPLVNTGAALILLFFVVTFTGMVHGVAFFEKVVK